MEELNKGLGVSVAEQAELDNIANMIVDLHIRNYQHNPEACKKLEETYKNNKEQRKSVIIKDIKKTCIKNCK